MWKIWYHLDSKEGSILKRFILPLVCFSNACCADLIHQFKEWQMCSHCHKEQLFVYSVVILEDISLEVSMI